MESDTDLSQLDDADLVHAASEAPKRAQQGDRQAFGPAHQLEKELRRRGLAEHNESGPLPLLDDRELAVMPTPSASAWWRFWR